MTRRSAGFGQLFALARRGVVLECAVDAEQEPAAHRCRQRDADQLRHDHRGTRHASAGRLDLNAEDDDVRGLVGERADDPAAGEVETSSTPSRRRRDRRPSVPA